MMSTLNLTEVLAGTAVALMVIEAMVTSLAGLI